MNSFAQRLISDMEFDGNFEIATTFRSVPLGSLEYDVVIELLSPFVHLCTRKPNIHTLTNYKTHTCTHISKHNHTHSH